MPVWWDVKDRVNCNPNPQKKRVQQLKQPIFLSDKLTPMKITQKARALTARKALLTNRWPGERWRGRRSPRAEHHPLLHAHHSGRALPHPLPLEPLQLVVALAPPQLRPDRSARAVASSRAEPTQEARRCDAELEAARPVVEPSHQQPGCSEMQG